MMWQNFSTINFYEMPWSLLLVIINLSISPDNPTGKITSRLSSQGQCSWPWAFFTKTFLFYMTFPCHISPCLKIVKLVHIRVLKILVCFINTPDNIHDLDKVIFSKKDFNSPILRLWFFFFSKAIFCHKLCLLILHPNLEVSIPYPWGHSPQELSHTSEFK